ncbi:hypothetical protein CBM2585_A80125 [Cupriavidus taiwanensis]|nr:hypothetical protein CBM2585_A80125 [Cupriavidus taiwanensis]
MAHRGHLVYVAQPRPVACDVLGITAIKINFGCIAGYLAGAKIAANFR